MPARIYRTRLELFERWYDEHGRDIRVSVASLDTLMRDAVGDSAFARLGRAVGDSIRPSSSLKMSSCP